MRELLLPVDQDGGEWAPLDFATATAAAGVGAAEAAVATAEAGVRAASLSLMGGSDQEEEPPTH